MSTVLIVIVVVLVLVVGVSLALGRATYEVDSAPDTEFLELEGTWIRYDVRGGGPPVVLVHGWLSSSAVWDQIARRLAQRFTVYTLDLTGFGESDKPLSGYGIRYGSRLLYAFCAHFGLARASVIGHDLGGAMAIKLASDHPDVVGRVILVSTPANEEQIDLPTPLWAATLPVIGPVFYALGRVARPVRSLWMRPFVLEPEDVTEEMLDDAASSTPAAMRQSLNIGRREIGGGRLARQSRIVRIPVMIITGEEDQIVDPQAAGVWARSLENTEVCLMDECGHMPMIEHPGEFNAQILAFLTGDARYLEQAGHAEGRAASEEADEERIAGDEVDTMEVDIQPGEGEDPAFGPSPSETEYEDDYDVEEEDEEEPPGWRQRFSRPDMDPEDEEPSWWDRLSGRDSEPDEEDSLRRETSETDETGQDEEDPTDDRAVRRFSDRFGGSSDRSARRSARSERAERRRIREEEEDTTDLSRFTANMPKDEDDEPRAPVEDEVREVDFYTPGEPEIGDDVRPFKSSPESRGFEETPLDEPSTFDDEPQTEPPDSTLGHEQPRRRPRRESSSTGDVPEVPGDLFDWGDSLDDFEPTRRRPKREGPLSDDTGDLGDDGTIDEPPGDPHRN